MSSTANLPQSHRKVMHLDNGEAIGLSHLWQQGQYCTILTRVGLVGCGIYDVKTAAHFNQVVAICRGTPSKPLVEPEDLLPALIVDLTPQAEALGVQVGMTGKQAAELLLRAGAQPAPPGASLFERLGGVYAIAAVVDVFIDRIMEDPRLNANPRVDEAHHRVSRAGFKYLVTEQVCAATGGPQRYTGRNMYDSHAELAITAAEWTAFLDDLQQTLDQFHVPGVEQRELFAIVESTKNDIVR